MKLEDKRDITFFISICMSAVIGIIAFELGTHLSHCNSLVWSTVGAVLFIIGVIISCKRSRILSRSLENYTKCSKKQSKKDEGNSDPKITQAKNSTKRTEKPKD